MLKLKYLRWNKRAEEKYRYANAYFFSDIFVSGSEWWRGYYRSTQCHRGLGLCWCVDPHGVEFAGTRTRGTKPDCGTPLC
jgi:hypothetical protein